MVEQRDINIILSNPVEWEKFRNTTILITGATGRLGMYLVEALNKADIDWNLNLRIIALARSREKLERVFGESLNLPNISTIVQDITEPVLFDGNVDYIFHTAGAASPKDFTEDPVGTLWGHVQGTRNVLEFARQKNTKKVLYVSTVEVYGDWQAEDLIREEDMGPMRCDDARKCYPEAKRLCETMLSSYKAQYGLDFVGVRLCHTLGPGISLDDGRSFAQFLKNVINGEDIVLHTDGSAKRTYTYSADAVGAMLLAFTRGDEDFYNVANTDNLISTRELAKLIAGLDPKQKVKVIFEKESGNTLKYLNYRLGIMNTDRILKRGRRPQVGLEEMFRWTLDSFIQNS